MIGPASPDTRCTQGYSLDSLSLDDWYCESWYTLHTGIQSGFPLFRWLVQQVLIHSAHRDTFRWLLHRVLIHAVLKIQSGFPLFRWLVQRVLIPAAFRIQCVFRLILPAQKALIKQASLTFCIYFCLKKRMRLIFTILLLLSKRKISKIKESQQGARKTGMVAYYFTMLRTSMDPRKVYRVCA